MKKRKINIKAILYKTIFYRIFIVLVQALFTYFILHSISFKQALNISVIWNLVNISLYFVFEYLFSKKWDTTIQTKGAVVWFTGLPCSGKSTIADKVRDILIEKGKNCERLDGDVCRAGKLSNDLGFSKEDRDKNINRITFVSKLLSRNNTIVLASFVSPYKETRNDIRKNTTNFIEIYVATPTDVCIKRDVKGMWKKALEGKIKGFTGLDDPYEVPETPELIIHTEHESIEQSAYHVVNYLIKKGYV